MAIEFNRDFNMTLRDQKAQRVVEKLEAKWGCKVHFESVETGSFIIVPALRGDTIKQALRECGGKFIYSEVTGESLRVKFSARAEGVE